MTEQQNQSAVVEEEAGEAVEPHHSQRILRRRRQAIKPAALSAIAIAIAIAAGIGLYGLNKQQATRQNATTSELASGRGAAKAQENQKVNWKVLSNSRPTS